MSPRRNCESVLSLDAYQSKWPLALRRQAAFLFVTFLKGSFSDDRSAPVRHRPFHIFHGDFSSGVAGEDRVRFSCDFYGGVRDEDHSLRLRRASRSLPPQRLELAGFHDSRDWVSTSDLGTLRPPSVNKRI